MKGACLRYKLRQAIWSRYEMHNTSSGAGSASVDVSTEGSLPLSISPKTVFHAPEGSLPPSCNTGVSSTRAYCDWLSMTFVEMPLARVQEFFARPEDHGKDRSEDCFEWTALERGGLGYKTTYQRGHLRIYADGQPGMGVHVVMSGEAVRQWESECMYQGQESWLDFFRSVRAVGGRFRRCDFAFDEHICKGDPGYSEPLLDMARIWETLKAKQVVTPFREADRLHRDKISLHDDSEVCPGQTIRLGSRTSQMFVRIYNKSAQLEQLDGLKRSDHHVRVEMEAKKDNAETLIDMVLQHGFEILPEVLLHYVDFKEPSDTDTNKSRWETAPWWSAFVNHCRKTRLTVGEYVAKTLRDKIKWLEKQTAPLLAVVVDCLYERSKVDGSDYKRDVASWFYTLVGNGRERRKPHHKRLLDTYVPKLAFGSGGLL